MLEYAQSCVKKESVLWLFLIGLMWLFAWQNISPKRVRNQVLKIQPYRMYGQVNWTLLTFRPHCSKTLDVMLPDVLVRHGAGISLVTCVISCWPVSWNGFFSSRMHLGAKALLFEARLMWVWHYRFYICRLASINLALQVLLSNLLVKFLPIRGLF